MSNRQAIAQRVAIVISEAKKSHKPMKGYFA